MRDLSFTAGLVGLVETTVQSRKANNINNSSNRSYDKIR